MFTHKYRRQCCPNCDTETTQRRRVPAHVVHGLFTVGTLGLWGISWAAVCVAARGERWHCLRCHAPEPTRTPGRATESAAGQRALTAVRA